MLSFARKTSVITGASQGISQAIAAALYESRASLVLVGRDRERLGPAATGLQHVEAPPPRLVKTDLLNPDDLALTAEQISASFPAVDILVNCGGAYLRGTWDEASPEKFNDLLKKNIIGPYALTRLLLPRVVAAR